MRVAVAAMLFVFGAAVAQGVSPMFSAVSQSMHRVCAISPDSRQCVVLQELFADQVAIEQGRMPDIKPSASPAEKEQFRAALRRAIAEDQQRTR